MIHSHIDRSKGERLTEIVEAAIRVFIRSGYRRAQMSDVAKEAGVAPGTLYLYVESKEALFELALRWALGEALPAGELPLPTPEQGALLKEIAGRLERNAALPKLATALERTSPGDVRAEFEGIVLELYEAINRYHRALSLVDHSAPDWPELARIFYAQTRRRVVEQLAVYLERRITEGELPEVPDPATAARLILETTAFFAMHRYNDPDAASITDEAARTTVLHALANAFSPR